MIRFLRILLPLLGVLGCLAGAQVAQASNLLTNSGFETSCPGAPCGWSLGAYSFHYIAGPGAQHEGSRSLVIETDASHFAKVSQCVNVGEQKFDASAWYELQYPSDVELDVEFFDQAGCAGQSSSSADTHGTVMFSWAQLSMSSIGGVGTKSALVNLFVQGIGADGAAALDDVSLAVHGTTAATVRSFVATRSPAGTLVRWRTAGETELAGFNVYRLEHGRKVKVNKHLIAARGANGGASYRLLDRGHRGARYRLEIVNLDGTRQWRTAR